MLGLPKAAFPWQPLARQSSFSFALAVYGTLCLFLEPFEQPRFLVMLWGNDRLMVKGLKHMAGQFLAMLLIGI